MKVYRNELIEFGSDKDFLAELIEAVNSHSGQNIELERTPKGVYIFYDIEISCEEAQSELESLRHELFGPEKNDRYIEAIDYFLDLSNNLNKKCEHFVNNGDKAL